MLYALLALVSAGAAGYFFYTFQQPEGTTTSMILGVVCAILAVAFAGYFLFNKMTHQEEIHITE